MTRIKKASILRYFLISSKLKTIYEENEDIEEDADIEEDIDENHNHKKTKNREIEFSNITFSKNLYNIAEV